MNTVVYLINFPVMEFWLLQYFHGSEQCYDKYL